MLTITNLCVELAIGEGSSAAFTKLHVRLGIEIPAAPPEARHITRTITSGLATLQEQRFETGTSQQQAAKQPTRPGANNHGPLRRRMRHLLCDLTIRFIRRRANAWIFADALQYSSLVLHFDQQREAELHMPTPRINRPLLHLEADQLVIAHAEQFQHR